MILLLTRRQLVFYTSKILTTILRYFVYILVRVYNNSPINPDFGMHSSSVSYIMGRPGLEPGANRLKAEYSTIELATPTKWCFRCTVYKDNTNNRNIKNVLRESYC